MMNKKLIALFVAITTVVSISANYRDCYTDASGYMHCNGVVEPVYTTGRVVDRTGRATGRVVEGTGRAAGDVVEGTGRAAGNVVEETAKTPGRVLGIFGRD